jgi:hypothetical protein
MEDEGTVRGRREGNLVAMEGSTKGVGSRACARLAMLKGRRTWRRNWGIYWKGESSRVVEYNVTRKTEAREKGINVWKVKGGYVEADLAHALGAMRATAVSTVSRW